MQLNIIFVSTIKACVRYLLSNFYFSPNDSPSKTMNEKMFFISSKNLFLFSRYSDFCAFIFPFFFRCQPMLEWSIQEKS